MRKGVVEPKTGFKLDYFLKEARVSMIYLTTLPYHSKLHEIIRYTEVFKVLSRFGTASWGRPVRPTWQENPPPMQTTGACKTNAVKGVLVDRFP